MGAPQIMVIITVVSILAGIIKIGTRADRTGTDGPATALAALLFILYVVAYQMLLWWGGFWG